MYGDGFKFDPYCYDNKAIALRIDGSVQTLRLNKDRHAKLPNGKTLFEGGIDSVWGEAGFDRSNLLYAKYPYTPNPKLNVKFGPREAMWTCLILFGLYYTVSRLRMFRNKKAENMKLGD